jgi:hypothetical protein
MWAFRNLIASLSRSTPYVRGKHRLGNTIGRLLTNFDSDQECISTVKMRDGSWMQLDMRSRTEQWSYWTGSYDNNILERLSSCLREKCIVFDVGAHVGFYSVALGRKLQALNGQLHVFEPAKSNFERLTTNILLNNIEGIGSAHNIALSDDEGIIEMSMENGNNSRAGNAVMVKGEIPTNYFGMNSKEKFQLTILV